MGKREKVSEWWEVWVCVPGKEPVRVDRYGYAIDVRVPREGWPEPSSARKVCRTSGRYAKLVHVTRYRKTNG